MMYTRNTVCVWIYVFGKMRVRVYWTPDLTQGKVESKQWNGAFWLGKL